MHNILIPLLLMIFLSSSPVSSCGCGEMVEPPTVILPYTIEKIENGQYYGSWKDGTEIQFSTEDIVTYDEILVGDTVLATFNREDLTKIIGAEFFYRETEDFHIGSP